MENINQIYVRKSHKTSTYSRWPGHDNNEHDHTRQCMGNTLIKAWKKLRSPCTQSFRLADSGYF